MTPEQLAALKAFAMAVITAGWSEEDLGPEDIEYLANKHDLVVKHDCEEANRAEWEKLEGYDTVEAGKGDYFYVLADWLKDTKA